MSAVSPISFGEAFRLWMKIGWLSFGGPAGQIALMHRELVERRRWISETRFLHALNYCMLLPGPEAQQLATYIGWLLHRTWGGIVAGGLFVLPGMLVMLVLSWLYVRYSALGPVAALFFGLKAAVLAVVIEAVLRIGTSRAQEPFHGGARRRGLPRDLFVQGAVSVDRRGRGRDRHRRTAGRCRSTSTRHRLRTHAPSRISWSIACTLRDSSPMRDPTRDAH